MRISTIAVALCIISLSACSTLERYSVTQNNVAKFDQGVHVAAASEIEFLHQVQKAECTGDYYKKAYAFAMNDDRGDGKAFKLGKR